ncbi:MAG: helix-turn-helix transcriptional regulator [Petrimonas sp.]|nr:helix-turn-helix transcriptional regulator [Petrimonas sp.]
MRERIRQIMENENLTPAKFADRLQINRANISHILNGRNNPSLDVVTKILSGMPYINTEWLINGTGQMYKDGFDTDSIPKEHDLFHQGPPATPQEKETVVKPEGIDVNKPEKNIQVIENKIIDAQKNNDKKIRQIIIYYNDSTFETFVPQPVK